MAVPGDAKRRRTVSIQVTLAVGIAVLVIITTLVVALPSLLIGAGNTIGLLRERTALVIDTAEAGLVDHLTAVEDLAQDFATSVRDGRIVMDDRDAVEDALVLSLAGVSQVVVIAFIFPDYLGVAAIRTPSGFESDEFDGSDDEEVILTLERLRAADDAVWEDVIYLEESGLPVLNLRAPIRADDGQFLGVLVATVDMYGLSRFLMELQQGGRGQTAFMLYGEDRVLAHPILADPFPGLSPEHPLPTIDQVADPVLSVWQDRTPGAADEYLDMLVDTDIEAGDERYFVVSRAFGRFGKEDLLLGSYFPEDVLIRELGRLFLSAVFTIVVLIAAVFLAIWFARRIARPIREIAAVAVQVGSLDLERIHPLRGSVITELNEQTRAFNTMLRALDWFATYVPRRLVQRLIRRGADVAPRSIERELTVLFTDIAGYTRLVEPLPAADTADFLNHHFAMLGECVEGEEGTIDKFIGDSLMAFWCAPDLQPDHVARACRAALAMKTRLTADNAARRAEGQVPVRLRVGLHTGPMVVGNIGAPGRMNYTTVGDAVNTGSRMEQLGKDLAPESEVIILITGDTAKGLSAAFTLKPHGKHGVRGRRELIDVFELVDGPDTPGG